MKRKVLIISLIHLFVLLSACSRTITNSEKSNDLEQQEVTITFVQHTFIRFSYNENKEINGYFFKNDTLAKTSLKFSKGYNLSFEDINNFDTSFLNYKLSSLEGDGYWSFTFFTTFFDLNSGFSCYFLEPCKLDNDLTLHFGIYG